MRVAVRTVGKEEKGLGKPMVEMELGVCGGNCLAGHHIQFFCPGLTTFPSLPCNEMGHVTKFWPVECVDMNAIPRPRPPNSCKLLCALSSCCWFEADLAVTLGAMC